MGNNAKSKKEEALLYHSEGRPGKIEVVPTKPYSTQKDLSLAYSPGVAEPCLAIQENPDDAYKYTAKGNLVAVISNGTAVLGLGDIGAMAGKPVMEGKGLLFKTFADIDVFDIEVNTKNTEQFIETVKNISVTFGGINLEDIKSPDCFKIEQTLEKELDIPVFHDDQHGTAIVVTAAFLNALKVVGKEIGDVKVVLNGPGAAGTAIIKMLLHAGVKNIIACDRHGAIYKNREWNKDHKIELAEITNPEQLKGELADVLPGADVFIGVSTAGALSTEMIKTMASDPIVFAMANPVPEIGYDDAKAAGVAVMGTGRSDKPNQINNLLCFPGIFKGALSVRARDINYEMKLAAAYAIADLVTDDKRSPEYIIPSALDPQVAEAVAAAVAKAAKETGVARI